MLPAYKNQGQMAEDQKKNSNSREQYQRQVSVYLRTLQNHNFL
jgi:hypothetical protein